MGREGSDKLTELRNLNILFALSLQNQLLLVYISTESDDTFSYYAHAQTKPDLRYLHVYKNHFFLLVWTLVLNFC